MPEEPKKGRGRGRREISAGGVVYRRARDGVEVVLIKASGRWSFPKGNVEAGETLEAAALREIAEETGLPLKRLQIAGRLPDIEYAFRWGRGLIFKKVHNFLVQQNGDAPFKPQLSEIEEVAWFPAVAARRLISFKNARETLDAAMAAVDAMELAS